LRRCETWRSVTGRRWYERHIAGPDEPVGGRDDTIP
jgi:hypothetical protein